MYEKDGEKYFIVDSHMHYWNAAPSNWVKGAEHYAKGWIECFHAYQSLGPAETHWPIEKFMAYTEDDLMKDVFTDGHVDIAIFQPTYLKEWYAEGFNTTERNAALGEKHPGMFIANTRFDPRDGDAGMDEFRRNVERYGAQEVATWYFEVWNEADGESYWKGTPEEFDKLHDYAVDAVRRALPTARVGGSDAAGGANAFTDQFYAHIARGTNYATGAKGTPTDFVSFHAKGQPQFVDGHVRMGIVAFAGSAQLAQLPTQSREDLIKAIDSFQLQRGTATGNGIMLSLATLFPDAGIDIAALGGRQAMRPRPIEEIGKQDPAKSFTPVAPGSYTSAAIIMLTDGQRTTGVDPLEAAKWAADRGVRVYTVGVGTVQGETIGFEGWSMRVRLDEETLKAVAARTNAEYFHAATAEDLKKVYETLSTRLTIEKKETEISSLMALLGAALALLAAGLSVAWHGRIF